MGQPNQHAGLQIVLATALQIVLSDLKSNKKGSLFSRLIERRNGASFYLLPLSTHKDSGAVGKAKSQCSSHGLIPGRGEIGMGFSILIVNLLLKTNRRREDRGTKPNLLIL